MVPTTFKELVEKKNLYHSPIEGHRRTFNTYASLIVQFKPTSKNSIVTRSKRGKEIIQRKICRYFPALYTKEYRKSIGMKK